MLISSKFVQAMNRHVYEYNYSLPTPMEVVLSNIVVFLLLLPFSYIIIEHLHQHFNTVPHNVIHFENSTTSHPGISYQSTLYNPHHEPQRFRKHLQPQQDQLRPLQQHHGRLTGNFMKAPVFNRLPEYSPQTNPGGTYQPPNQPAMQLMWNSNGPSQSMGYGGWRNPNAKG